MLRAGRRRRAGERAVAVARVCVIRQGFFPLDTRVRREVDALAASGHQVDVICLRRDGQPWRERLGPVTAYRLPLPLERGGRLRYVAQYVTFLVAAGLLAAMLSPWRRWKVVQVNSMPDALVFAAAVPRLLGARVLLDLHECMPEFFATKYGVGMRHPGVRLLVALEQASIRFSDHTTTCTNQMRDAFVSRGAPAEKIDVVLNAADEAIFDADRYPPAERQPGRFRLICHGAVEERYGLDTILRAVALVRGEIPGIRVDFYGDGAYRTQLEQLAEQQNIDGAVHFSDGWAPMEQLLQAIAAADVGVVAIKRDRFRDLTHCNKMFDFIAMRRPAIVSRTRSVEAYFDDSCFRLFESGDAEDLARAIRELYADPKLGERLVKRAAEVSEPYRWARQQQIYDGVVRRLIDRQRPGR
jgi:glycosyltransferase involved in cell wall biosynthesis